MNLGIRCKCMPRRHIILWRCHFDEKRQSLKLLNTLTGHETLSNLFASHPKSSLL